MRRRIREGVSRALWSGLAKVGLPRERWLAWPRLVRRTVKVVLWLVLALVLIRAFGVWKTSALAAALVVLVLAVPWYERLTVGGKRVGKWVVPGAVLAIAATYPYYWDAHAAGADLRPVPAALDDGRDDDLHDHGPGAELRRRLCGAARSRLRRLLRRRCVHGGLVRVEPVRKAERGLRRGRPLQGRHRLPLLDLAGAFDGGGRDGADRGADRSADAAAAWRLPRDRHARLRRDPAPDRPQRRQPVRHRLQPHQRDGRHHPDRRSRVRQLGARPPRPAGPNT